MKLKTSKGNIEYKTQFYFTNHIVDDKIMLDNICILSVYLNGIGITWGPVFDSLHNIIDNKDFTLRSTTFCIYILKEDEERFKDVLYSMIEDDGYNLVRYERRGLYYLKRKCEYIKVFILSKVSPNMRCACGTEFFSENFIQNTVIKDFKGVKLRIPHDIDEHRMRQCTYSNMTKQNLCCRQRGIGGLFLCVDALIQDYLPNRTYYKCLEKLTKRNWMRYKMQCNDAGVCVHQDVPYQGVKYKKYKKVLTVGVYDILHKGHVELYRRAKGLGSYLIVAAQESDYICKYKPSSIVLCSTEDRVYMIKAIRHVDEVITYTDVDKVVQEVDFDIFITGPDQCHSGFQRAIQWCGEHGKEHYVLDRTQGVSSSDLKVKIAEK